MDLDLPSCSRHSESPTEHETKKKTKKLQSAPTICEICQGKATGHHYDVASCNGCKSFFRRIITEKPKYRCKKINKCFENLKPGDTMPRCRGCRFQRCVERGMNPLGIHSQLQLKIEAAIKYDLPVIIEKPRRTLEAQVGELIDKMIRLDIQSEKFRDCSFNPDHFPSLKDCVKEERSMLPMADKYEPMKGWPLQKDVIDEDFKLRKTPQKHHPFVKRWLIYELLIQIEISKAMPFFSNLSYSDRLHLIQDTVLMTSNLTRSFYSFEQKSDRLLRPDGMMYYDLPLPFEDEIRKSLRDDVGMRCLSAILRVGIDRVEFVLLRALIMSNPAVLELSENAQNYLIKERQKYNIALFRYIMAKHGASGPARFATIIGFIDVLEHQQRDQRDLNIFINLSRPKHFKIPILDEVMKS